MSVQWRLRRLLRQTDRRLGRAVSQADIVAAFERFTDEVIRLSRRSSGRRKRQGTSYLP